jgi:hypothetical protein
VDYDECNHPYSIKPFEMTKIIVDKAITLQKGTPSFQSAKSISKTTQVLPKKGSVKYSTIRDVQPNKPKYCNVLGMITEYAPITTVNGKMKRFFTVCDSTGSIPVISFCSEIEKFVNPEYYGQIISLQNVECREYSGKPQLHMGYGELAFTLYPLI